MKTKVLYFIAYYGPSFCRAWDNDSKRWVPYGMDLYTTFYNDLDSAFEVLHMVRRACSGWRDGIAIDSKLTAA
jgi:hypothetical protein